MSAALDRGLAATLRHDRRVVAGSLALIALLAWVYLWRAAAGMSHLDMEMMQAGADLTALALTFLMWAVMMVGMMLPSVAPATLLYASLVRRHRERGSVLPDAGFFVGGYLAVWTGFSLLAALLQAALEQLALMQPMMHIESRVIGAVVLIAAGLHQWLPVKDRCLSRCRNPLQYFMTRWRNGAAGAVAMGAEHGLYCLGCCWPLMLLLFVTGVMNLLWVALLAAFVLVEKLLGGPRVTRAAGAVLIVAGLLLLGVGP